MKETDYRVREMTYSPPKPGNKTFALIYNGKPIVFLRINFSGKQIEEIYLTTRDYPNANERVHEESTKSLRKEFAEKHNFPASKPLIDRAIKWAKQEGIQEAFTSKLSFSGRRALKDFKNEIELVQPSFFRRLIPMKRKYKLKLK